MNYLIFGQKGCSYTRLPGILPDRENLFFVGNSGDTGLEAEHVRFIPISALTSLDTRKYTAVVSSPYWIQHVLSISPAAVIAHLQPCPEHEDSPLWNKYSGLLASHADLIVTQSERIYLEQCLQRDHVFLWEHTDELLRGAIDAMLKGQLLKPWVTKQWNGRKQYYLSLLEQQGPHETISYLLASYCYFLDEPVAKTYLEQSFEQMILKEHSQCLNSHFRFFSAMEARSGDLEKAVRIYEITALSQEEKKSIETVKLWQTQKQWPLIQAEIYRVNEDYRSAIEILENNESLPSKTMLLQNYIQIYRWEDALAILDSNLLSDTNRIMAEVIRGYVHLIHHKSHMAIRTFLRASVEDWNTLSHIDEIISFDKAVGRLAAGSYGTSSK